MVKTMMQEVVLKRALLQCLVDAEDEHFACESYLGKSYREPYLDDFFSANLPGQHSFLVSKDMMTAHGAMHSGDMVRLATPRWASCVCVWQGSVTLQTMMPTMHWLR